MKVGDRVEILHAQKCVAALRHRKGRVYGRITHIDGAYIDVRPSWCKWEIEFYPNEIKEAQ